MHALIVSLSNQAQMDTLHPKLEQAFGQVASYRLGRRLSGGPVQLAEGRLKRLHPEYLLERAVLLLIASAESVEEMVDSLFDVVARLDDPSGARVQVVCLTDQPKRQAVGSAGQ